MDGFAFALKKIVPEMRVIQIITVGLSLFSLSPVHVFIKANATEYKGISFQTNVHRIAA